MDAKTKKSFSLLQMKTTKKGTFLFNVPFIVWLMELIFQLS